MTTYYEKRGRRYVPVAEHEVLVYGRRFGFYLQHVQPGSTSTTPLPDPKFAEVEAALRVAQEAMLEAMRKRCEITGVQTRHVPEKDRAKYKRAWEAWKAIVGDVPAYFEGVSMHDVVDAGVEAVRARLREDSLLDPGNLLSQDPKQ
jgi:hypothetical protein